MNTIAYPQFFALLGVQGSFEYERPYSQDRMLRVEQAIESLVEGDRAGEIPNPVYQDARECINRALETAWSRLPAPSWDSLNGQDKLFEAFHGTHLSVTNHAGKLKRMVGLEHPMLPVRQAFLDEVTPLAIMTNELKAKAVKRRVKTEEERAEEEEQKFVVPPTSSKVVLQVKQLLEDMVNERYVELRDFIRQNHQSILNRFLEKEKEAKSDPTLNGKDFNGRAYTTYTPIHHASYRHQGRTLTDQSIFSVLSMTLESYDVPGAYYEDAWREKKDSSAILDAMAEEKATLIRDRFIYKNIIKLSGILDGKGEDQLAGAEIIGNTFSLGGFEGRFKFTFHDGSGFDITTSYVYVVNQHGTQFGRVPLTFHDVLLPGGEKMPSPSEERMHTIFLAATKSKEQSKPTSLPKARRRAP